MRAGDEHPAERAHAGGSAAAGRRHLIEGFDRLRANTVEQSHAVHARHRAERRTTLLARALPQHVRSRVLGQRDAWMPALLRAPMHEAVLADIEITAAGAALPVVRAPEREVPLEIVLVLYRIERRSQRRDLVVDAQLLRR